MPDYCNESGSLKQALELYAKKWMDALSADEEMQGTHEFSPEFERMMAELIRGRQKPSFIVWIKPLGRRAAVILLAVLLLLSITVFSVKALREPVVNFIIEVYEKASTIIFTRDDPTASVPSVIEEAYLPACLPEGYELVSEDKYPRMLEYIYSDENGNDLQFKQAIFDGTQMNLDSEGTVSESIQINGITGIYFSNKGKHILTWNNGIYVFHLESAIEKDELIKVAESLEIKT